MRSCLLAGLLSLAFFLLHCFSMVVAFHAYERKSLAVVGIVGGLHLVASLTVRIFHTGILMDIAQQALDSGSYAVG